MIAQASHAWLPLTGRDSFSGRACNRLSVASQGAFVEFHTVRVRCVKFFRSLPPQSVPLIFDPHMGLADLEILTTLSFSRKTGKGSR